MRLNQSIVIAAPPKLVWDYITDPANVLHYMSGVTRWEVVGEQRTGLGARYRMLIKVGSAEVGGLIEVVEFTNERDMAWSSVTGVDQRGRWRVRELGPDRTRVELRFAYGVAGSGLVGYLSELQPAFFCEVSPALARERALEHGGWATIVTARTAVEARVLVTERLATLRVQGRDIHQVGLPYHWGSRGLTTGDSANDLLPLALDPNVHIQEAKAATCDIRPGRRPRGPELTALVDGYRRRAATGGTAR